MANLNHDDLLLLNRLLNNHIVGKMPKELQSVCDKLMDYAERTTGTFDSAPLQLDPAVAMLHHKRLVFSISTLDAGV